MLHHFYHIYANGLWHDPVSEHIRAMKEYGLYDSLKTFAVGMVGSEKNCNDVKEFLKSQGIEYVLADQKALGWEQVTQIPMWEFCKDNDGLILYAHSKGASDPSPVNIRWRRSMIWCMVCEWKTCVQQLKTHDTVGVHWIHPVIAHNPEHVYGNWMFGGTFWWARCELVRTFQKPLLTSRHEAEAWIGYKYAEKPFSVYDFTPYWPNTNTFADEWIGNPDYKPDLTPKSYQV